MEKNIHNMIHHLSHKAGRGMCDLERARESASVTPAIGRQ